MKKVSFIKGVGYGFSDISYLPNDIKSNFFSDVDDGFFPFYCTESFTAEITVKIVPYEQQ